MQKQAYMQGQNKFGGELVFLFGFPSPLFVTAMWNIFPHLRFRCRILKAKCVYKSCMENRKSACRKLCHAYNRNIKLQEFFNLVLILLS
jgi:hypothetical protein